MIVRIISLEKIKKGFKVKVPLKRNKMLVREDRLFRITKSKTKQKQLK